MTSSGSGPRSSEVNASPRPRVQVCCDACYRMSPLRDGPLDEAQGHFRTLGWMWCQDGRLLCPISQSREATMPPPLGFASSESDAEE
jgi:hypothetical protein